MLVYIAYFGIALALLVALTGMILQISAQMEGCSKTRGAAWSAGLTIATGYLAIGLGGVILAAILIPALIASAVVGLLASLGVASLALGLGFTQAMATLRGVVAEAGAPQVLEPEPRVVRRAAKEGPWEGQSA